MMTGVGTEAEGRIAFDSTVLQLKNCPTFCLGFNMAYNRAMSLD